MRVRSLSIVALVLLWCGAALAGVKTSTASGNASAGATWVGGAAPVTGDQVVINHAVTFDAGLTLGISPPTTPVTVPTLSSQAGGGALAGGTYRCSYTFVDSTGKESCPSPLNLNFTLTGGDTLRIALPALATGTVSRNIYLTPAGGAAGTETLYATGVSTAGAVTYLATSASWTDGTTTQAAAAVPPVSYALKLNTSGSVIVNTGVTLVVRGDIQRNNSIFELDGTSILEFDSSQNVAPTSCRYYFFNGMVNGQTAGILRTGGTSLGAMATIRSNASGSPAMIRTWVDSNGILGSSSYNLQFVNFLRIGSATFQGGLQSTGATQILNNCLFNTCGVWQHSSSAAATDNVQITNCSWTASQAAPLTIGSSVAMTTGTRLVSGCVFDTTVTFGGVRDFTITGNLFYLQFTATSGNWALFRDNLVRTTTTLQGWKTFGDTTNCFGLSEAAAPVGDNNPHFSSGNGAGTDETHTYWIGEYTGNDFNGDFFLHLGSAKTYTLKYNIMLPNGATPRNNSGVLLTMGADVPGQNVIVEHNTGFTGGQPLLSYSEGSPANHSGMLNSFKSNIGWADAVSYGSSIGPYMMNDSQTTATDVANPANIVKNCRYNQSAGSAGNGYNGGIWSSQPGVTDINANPQFTDDSRKFATWAASLGSTGTTAAKIADGLAQLAKRNDPTGYNPAYAISGASNSLIDWVRAGFAPTNAALHNAGHDGTDIGAVPMAASSNPVPAIYNNMNRRRRATFGNESPLWQPERPRRRRRVA